jgi:uncharacterized protein YggU (UPF0235/DUF167 family)
MKRHSARARRKKKKVLIEALAIQVTDLTNKNRTLHIDNDSLKIRIAELDAALGQANATISTLFSKRSQTSQISQALENQEALRSFLRGAVPAMNPIRTGSSSRTSIT